MSEYQFYEFQAIDRPLSDADQQHVHSLSSRVKLTATNAQFLYHYGDFRGQPEQLLDRCFDMLVYVASFGVRQLMIRLPKGTVDPKILGPYCVKRLISITTTEKSLILNINIVRDDYGGWITEETYAASLLALRQDLLQGDLRLLYLAWLAAGFAEEAPDAPEDMIEPPVPANLQKLSPALTAFARLFEIDSDLISAAALESPAAVQPIEPIGNWIAALPDADWQAYLVRVAQGETHVGMELMQRLRQQFGNVRPALSQSPGRSLAELMTIADEQGEIQAVKAKKSAASARAKYLKTIAPRADEIWQEAMDLIELKQAKPYEAAVAMLVDLRDLAASQGNLTAFEVRISSLKKQFSSRSGLMTRIQAARLLT
jgi:hypothetical protein